MKEISNLFLFFSNNKVGGDYITFTYRHRKEIIITLLILITIISSITYFYTKKPKKKETTPKITFVKKKEKKEEIEEYKVDIKGEVINPGIYSVKVNTRIIDVINEAGGLTENADTSVLNLSKKVEDEMVIIIYSKQQVIDFTKTKEIEKQVEEKCTNAYETLVNGACIKVEEEKKNTKININTATKEELMTLSGIGESKAEDIIKYREKEPFTNIEDIKKVNGIGDSLFAKIKENITI